MARVFVSSAIDVPIDMVWAEIRDFNALPRWHPAIVRSAIENSEPSDKVGCVRNFDLVDGGKIREKLLALDDVKHVCVYSILDSPMPLRNYVATLRLLPITDGNRTYIEWAATFDCAADVEKGLVESIGKDVFQAGFNALKRSLGT
ncbi:MAG TPA: MxaD family protein [Planctomycetaceae bacterium]|nr:MxaD family protein [Planctomycetaceae bacterium]